MPSEIKYIHSQDIHNTKAAENFLPFLTEVIKPSSVIDIGCGLGTWLNILKLHGCKEIRGVDGYNVDQSKLLIDANEFLIHDLGMPLRVDRKFDLCICLEVAEHLPEVHADTLIQTLISCSDNILFSAALPMQGGQNHLNEQPFNYWVKKFNLKGYTVFDLFRDKIWNNSGIDWWYRQNIFFVQKHTGIQKAILDFYHPERYVQIAKAFAHSQIEINDFQNGNLSVKTAFKILVKSIKKSLSRS